MKEKTSDETHVAPDWSYIYFLRKIMLNLKQELYVGDKVVMAMSKEIRHEYTQEERQMIPLPGTIGEVIDFETTQSYSVLETPMKTILNLREFYDFPKIKWEDGQVTDYVTYPYLVLLNPRRPLRKKEYKKLLGHAVIRSHEVKFKYEQGDVVSTEKGTGEVISKEVMPSKTEKNTPILMYRRLLKIMGALSVYDTVLENEISGVLIRGAQWRIRNSPNSIPLDNIDDVVRFSRYLGKYKLHADLKYLDEALLYLKENPTSFYSTTLENLFYIVNLELNEILNKKMNDLSIEYLSKLDKSKYKAT